MASNYTTHFGLCQWEPSDSFIRAEFNADNLAVDGALFQSQTAAAQALAGQELISYNVLNLYLQDYYGGKVGNGKKALVFDGFMDGSQVESLTTALTVRGSEKYLYLEATPPASQSFFLGNNHWRPLSRNGIKNAYFTAPVTGQVSSVDLYLQGDVNMGLRLPGGDFPVGRVTSSSQALVSKSVSAPLVAGTSCTLVTSANEDSSTGSTSETEHVGFRLNFTAVTATTGTMVSQARDVGTTYSRAQAWVRHDKGTISMSLWDGASSLWRPMTRGGTRGTVESGGTTCTETAFTLDGTPAGTTSLKVKLEIATSPGRNVKVFDYGVIVM